MRALETFHSFCEGKYNESNQRKEQALGNRDDGTLTVSITHGTEKAIFRGNFN